MKYRPKRFILFAVLVVFLLYYTIYVLNTIELGSGSGDDGSSGKKKLDYKNEVNRLKDQISLLEHKAQENERNYKSLQNVYERLKEVNQQNKQQQQAADKKPEQVDGGNADQQQQEHQQKPLEPPPQEVEKNNNNMLSVLNKWSIEKDEKSYGKQCQFIQEQTNKNSDVSTAELYEKLTFDDIDGGVWKQGFDITYDPKQWSESNKLKVIIVPHSHNDPGWLMTFEDYFQLKTRHILDTIVNVLSEKPTRKFVWAEISYLSLWWNQASDDMKSKLRKLIVETGQLEIVTGGWVMTDEANSHYYAMIEQMVEGHAWLRANIDESLRPNFGWSIDPFGYTPTMAYLLKQMGFDSMVIQRVHYHLKKYMAQTNRFEFNWRQSWTTPLSKETDIFCHVMPFYSYDVPHTCGPDPKICCQFDFKRLSRAVSCPWGIQPQAINSNNVHERAQLLLDQYRKKSQLYGDKTNHNVLLVQLGDDFRYTDMGEARDQFENYESLIEYMNNNKDWNVEVKFGTLRDYFDLVTENNIKNHLKIESFSGDFFTYADRQDHYWSGYYTSRPYYKRLDRIVEYYLRSAEILFSFSNLLQSISGAEFKNANQLFNDLLIARRNLGLFQHHDGITGTAKTPVVNDYALKLRKAVKHCKTIIENAAAYLLTNENTANVFSIDDAKIDAIISIDLEKENEEKKVSLFNPGLTERNELIHLRINTANVDIYDQHDKKINDYQLSLIWPNTQTPRDIESNKRMPNLKQLNFALDFDSNYVEISFDVKLAPLSFSTYRIVKRSVGGDKKENPPFSQVTFYAADISNKFQISQSIEEKLPKDVKNLNLILFESSSSSSSSIVVKIDDKYEAHFSAQTGYLTHLLMTSTKEKIAVDISMVKYGTTDAREKSGAYLFLPDGPAKPIETTGLFQWIRVEQKGTKRHRVCTNLTHIMHCVELYPSLSQSNDLKYPLIGVWNMVDLRETVNYELAMLIKTDIQNKDTFFTDLNGFQYAKRKHYSKIPIQANVYPMPSGAFIQDSKKRLSLLSTQPLGVTSLENSQLQVFLDRHLDQDDNRGLEQAANDNRLTPSRFYVLLEALNDGGPSENADDDSVESIAAKNPSLLSQWLSFDLMHPTLKLVLTNSESQIKSVRHLANKDMKYPCDLRLVNLRTMQQTTKKEQPKPNEAGLILHRVLHEDCPAAPFVQLPPKLIAKCENERDSEMSFEDFFSDIFANLSVESTYLTLVKRRSLNPKPAINKKDPIHNHVQPMQIEAFKISIN